MGLEANSWELVKNTWAKSYCHQTITIFPTHLLIRIREVIINQYKEMGSKTADLVAVTLFQTADFLINMMVSLKTL